MRRALEQGPPLDLPPSERKRIASVAATGERHPLSLVNFHDALVYCHTSEMDLPTEAEWERAARGTDGRRFPWGDLADLKLANKLETSAPRPDGIPVHERAHAASPVGCIQMAGNVAEWCLGAFDPRFYATMPLRAPLCSHGQGRVIRGGSTERSIAFARTTSRDYVPPDRRHDFVGFRPVLRPPAAGAMGGAESHELRRPGARERTRAGTLQRGTRSIGRRGEPCGGQRRTVRAEPWRRAEERDPSEAAARPPPHAWGTCDPPPSASNRCGVESR